MKRMLAAASVVAAMAMASPANADPVRAGHAYHDTRGHDRSGYGDYGSRDRGRYDHRFSREDLQRLQARIDWGVESGRLNRHEARRLNYQLADLRQRARYYWRTDGLSWRERQDLEGRFDWLRQEVRRQMRDGDVRRPAYGY